MRRRSGDLNVGFWNRGVIGGGSDEGLLIPPPGIALGVGIDPLRKADSLRSFSPGSDNVFLSNERIDAGGSRGHLCSQCGERSISREDIVFTKSGCGVPAAHHSLTLERRSYEREIKGRSASTRARSEERGIFAKEWGMSTLSLEMSDHTGRSLDPEDDEDRGVYEEAYASSNWLYVSANEELRAWRREVIPPTFIPPHVRIPGFSYPEAAADDESQHSGAPDSDTEGSAPTPVPGDNNGSRPSSPDSTCSEREFRSRYQAITHRMIHRKASVEMYRRIINRTFQTDKTVYVLRGGGEFGFRIHGSRPVVVSAIEGGTPAEDSGLAVGDIVVAVNEVNVVDASHSDVVRLAHAGNGSLRLDVARTRDLLTPLVTNDPTPVCAGYLYKLGGPHRSSGAQGKIARKWRRRWFALKKDHCLYYYKSEMEDSPLGAIHLSNYSVHALTDGVRPYAFTVAKFGGTTLHLAARTEDARKRWGQMITQAALQAAQRDELIEESARRVQQSPGAIATPDCFGYLWKLGSRWHHWKRHYFVLKDACLYFFRDTDSTSAIGVVHLHGYRVQSSSLGGKKHGFELIPPETKFRHFFLASDSDCDKKRWMAGLEYSIDRWIKAG